MNIEKASSVQPENSEDNYKKYIQTHVEPTANFCKKEVVSDYVKEHFLNPQEQVYFEDQGIVEFSIQNILFQVRYERVLPFSPYAKYEEDSSNKENMLSKKETNEISDVIRGDINDIIQIKEFTIDDQKNFFRLSDYLPAEYRIYLDPKSEKTIGDNRGIHQRNDQRIIVCGNISSLYVIFALLHEVGHIASTQNKEQNEKILEIRRKKSADMTLEDKAIILREERDADAFVLKKFRPFLHQAGLDNQTIIKLCDYIRSKGFQRLQAAENKAA